MIPQARAAAGGGRSFASLLPLALAALAGIAALLVLRPRPALPTRARSAGSPAAYAAAPAEGYLRGFRSRSLLVFEEQPATPHSLDVVYGFPDRGYWRIQPVGGRPWQRLHVYRRGAQVFHVQSGEGDSLPLHGDEALRGVLQMELRLAAMRWPEGHDWQRSGELFQATLDGVGRIEARAADLGAAPAEFRSFLAGGAPVEVLSELAWVEEGGRRRPRALAFSSAGQLVWRETIEWIEEGGLFLDRYFLPPDRLREGVDETEGPAELIHVGALPAHVGRRFPLAEGSSWLETLAQARSLRESWSAALSLEVESRVAVGLSEVGEPTSIELRLADPDAAPPKGWERAEPATGAKLLISDPRWIDQALLRRLSVTLPAGASPDAPYVRIAVDPTAEDAEASQLVVPARKTR